MATLGQWSGRWLGDWQGVDGEEVEGAISGQAGVTFGASGTLTAIAWATGSVLIQTFVTGDVGLVEQVASGGGGGRTRRKQHLQSSRDRFMAQAVSEDAIVLEVLAALMGAGVIQ